MSAGVEHVEFYSLGSGSPQLVAGEIVAEAQACISVNGTELATFMCSPEDLEELAIGFLYNEGILNGIADISSLHISDSNCVDVWVNRPFEPPERLIVTAGCGGGVTFDDLSQQHEPLRSALQVSPELLAELMKQMHLGAELYQRSRGIHTAVLADEDGIHLQVEDVGRHNCLDKLCGAALKQQIRMENRILLSSGRISSEMINKARKMGTPIVCSRTSPTSLSIQLAQSWNMAVVAYLRQNRMRVYTHPERISGLSAEEDGSQQVNVLSGGD